MKQNTRCITALILFGVLVTSCLSAETVGANNVAGIRTEIEAETGSGADTEANSVTNTSANTGAGLGNNSNTNAGTNTGRTGNSSTNTSSRNNTTSSGNLIVPGGHIGAVNAVAYDNRGRLLSAGADGFLEIWDIRRNTALERFQVSVNPLQFMTLRPGKTQVAVAERSPIGTYKVSVWDYTTKRQIFSLPISAVSYINYSAAGNILIIAQRTSILLINADTGASMPLPNIVTSSVVFAATGRSERSMVTYSSFGVLSYWDLTSGNALQQFNAPSQMQSPILFSNNRFLGGIDSQGLVVIDAVSGNILDRETRISYGILIPLDSESTEFLCLAIEANYTILYRFNVTNNGRLELKRQWRAPQNIAPIVSGTAAPDVIVLGTNDGNVWIGRESGSARKMTVRNKTLIAEATGFGSYIAILTKDNQLAFIPLDYNRLTANTTIAFSRIQHTQLTGGIEETDRLILWQDSNTQILPVIRDDPSSNDMPIERLSLRFPLRSVSSFGKKMLFLDSRGNITVISTETGAVMFTFSSIAALDAVFLDDRYILIGSGAVSGSTPFMMVNMQTGETVPLYYPAQVGARVYRGASGIPYGVVIEMEGGFLKTAIIMLNTSNPSASERIFEWEGEDTSFGMAEVLGLLTTTLGNQGAFFYDPREGSLHTLERSPGLPRHIVNGGRYIVSVDSDGNIVWYDPITQRIMALLHLYKDGWVLEREGRRTPLEGRVRGL